VLLSLRTSWTPRDGWRLVKAFVAESLVERGMIADYAIHRPDTHGDQRNYHAHIMVTTRAVGPEGFGHKARAWDNPDAVRALREEWADVQNRHLRQALGEGLRRSAPRASPTGARQKPRSIWGLRRRAWSGAASGRTGARSIGRWPSATASGASIRSRCGTSKTRSPHGRSAAIIRSER